VVENLNYDVRHREVAVMQSTQPNGTVFFRAVVMLGFLGIIFYVALSGNALPDAARKQIEKFLPEGLFASKPSAPVNANASSAAAASSEAPLFNIPGAGKTVASGNIALSAPLDNSAAPRQLAADGSATLIPLPSGSGAAPALANYNYQSAPVTPANYQAPVESRPSAALASNGMSNAPANPFSQIQARLKQLGATYYLLETWGNEQQFYRFYCKIAVGGNTNFTHCFESTSSDSLQAMTEVLKQVEASRSAK
jgi:hypothetical protein